MTSIRTAPQISNSELKDFSVLIIDPNEDRSARYEAQTELDLDLQRVSVYFATSMHEGRDAVKTRKPNLAIYPSELDGHDLVSLQLEFRNACKTTGLVPLCENPTLQQYRESRRIGGVVDFAPTDTFETYTSLRDLIIQSCRAIAAENPGLEEGLNYVGVLQRALTLSHPEKATLKSDSSILCREMTSWFDLSTAEVTKLILAEKLYFPEIKLDEYKTLLDDDPFGLTEVLNQTASSQQPGTRPSTTIGLIITAANTIAQWKSEQASEVEIIDRVKARPPHLMQISLRIMTAEKISQVLSQLEIHSANQAVG